MRDVTQHSCNEPPHLAGMQRRGRVHAFMSGVRIAGWKRTLDHPSAEGEGCDDSCPDAAMSHCLIRGIGPHLAVEVLRCGGTRMPSAYCRTWVGNRATRHRRRRLRHHRARTPDEYAGATDRAVQPLPQQTASSRHGHPGRQPSGERHRPIPQQHRMHRRRHVHSTRVRDHDGGAVARAGRVGARGRRLPIDVRLARPCDMLCRSGPEETVGPPTHLPER
jgi:hypothetical protein